MKLNPTQQYFVVWVLLILLVFFPALYWTVRKAVADGQADWLRNEEQNR